MTQGGAMASMAQTERNELCTLFETLGPEAPTLCGDWTTRDLAGHLVVRESRPDAALGIVVKPFAGWTEKVRAGAAGHDWPDLVRQVRNGPPLWSPTRIAAVDSVVNSLEFFVHHEDVRRAQPQWQPRTLPERMDFALWEAVSKRAKLHLRRAAVGVELRTPDGRSVVAREGDPVVTVTGAPAELVLLMFGRADHAELEYAGADDAVASLRGTSFAV
jgi:uncharacterized protein (TIGR03085 family)